MDGGFQKKQDLEELVAAIGGLSNGGDLAFRKPTDFNGTFRDMLHSS